MVVSDSNSPIGFNDFHRYKSGEMSHAEQHKLEKRMLEDPMVAEAYEGFLLMGADASKSGEIRLDLTAGLKNAMGNKRKNMIPLWAYATAASVIISLGAYWLVFISNRGESNKRMVAVEFQKESAKIGPKEEIGSVNVPKTAPTKIEALPQKTVPAPIPSSSPAPAAEESDPNQLETLAAADQAEEQLAVSEPIPTVGDPTAGDPAEGDPTAGAPVAPASAAPAVSQQFAKKAASPLHANAISANQVNAKLAARGNTIATDSLPAPRIGWSAYQTYLHISTFLEQRNEDLTVSFLVNTDGSLTNLTAVGPKDLRREAIRIVQEGPAWQPLLRNGKTINARSQVRLHFHSAQ
ncbi:energy transducer TonB [Dyadobacter arcticus]|uniref:TonB C-terminal domain-containing protein n=1 Tax=Dyadobacter arcticus TaxID=1078754 RepID=A0ABX0UL58_9BACT|nr:energy transducer TonB [Dyadobacter arcticus]NIJ53637.1 hypothetical protein [Dyadobacter arcticus]